MAEQDENEVIEEEEERMSQMPACWRTGMDGNLCRYGNLVDGFLCLDFVICRI